MKHPKLTFPQPICFHPGQKRVENDTESPETGCRGFGRQVAEQVREKRENKTERPNARPHLIAPQLLYRDVKNYGQQMRFKSDHLPVLICSKYELFGL